MIKDRNISRIVIIGGFILALFAFLTCRLWIEQVLSHAKYDDKFRAQSVRRVRKPPLRGRIISADGKILADNDPSYDLVFHLNEMRQPGRRKKTISYIHRKVVKLSKIIKRAVPLAEKDIVHQMRYYPVMPLTIFKKLKPQELAALSELTPPVPGMEVQPRSLRVYPFGEIAAHFLGYARKNDRKKAEDGNKFFYYVPDMVGIEGLELAYNDLTLGGDRLRGLRGEPGDYLVQVDKHGYEHSKLPNGKHPQHGNNAVLTIDMRAQLPAYKLMKDKVGALVMLDADSGKVLAMVSTPSYDNNKYVTGWSRAEYAAMLNNPNKPLINRAAVGGYAPGSIFKPLISLALINFGVDPYATMICDKNAKILGKNTTCMGTHGPINMVDALKKSCNDYFITLGAEMSIEHINKLLTSAGIGQKTGFDIYSSRCFLPGEKAKWRIYRTHWNKYDTGQVCFGQSILNVTPLQAAMYTAALGNGGKLYRPYLLDRLEDRSGNTIYQTAKKVNSTLATSSFALEVVKEGMYKVVNESGGSGVKARNDKIILHGKTASAEVKIRGRHFKNTWFACYGAYKGKNYAMVVLVEKGHYGGSTCAPIAKEVFLSYLNALDKDDL